MSKSEISRVLARHRNEWPPLTGKNGEVDIGDLPREY